MNSFVVLAVLSSLAGAVTLVAGIASMMRGGERAQDVNTRLMWRPAEFRVAAFALILAAIFFAVGQ